MADFGRSREDIFRFAIQMIETHGNEVDLCAIDHKFSYPQFRFI
jgi:hypothetical protein